MSKSVNVSLTRILIALMVLALGLSAISTGQHGTSDKPNAKSAQVLKNAQKRQAGAKSAYLRNTRDLKARKTYVDATNALGKITMDSPLLTSKEKYPAALRLYREVIKVDPKNQTATGWIKQIEAIYRGLGKPIPK